MERQPLSTSVNNRDSLRALEERLAEVRSRIDASARGAGRDPAGVRLIAVAKHVAPEVIDAAATVGVDEFGENYVKDLEIKRRVAPDATWHFVGRLQSNKVDAAIRSADVIQTLEPGRAGARIIELAGERDPLPDFLIEVDFTGTRVGVRPDGLEAFAEELIDAGVPVGGLMTVAPLGEDPRPSFSSLRELGERLRRRHQEAKELSMGMSADLEVAVEEGATMVRVGTAIFGQRRR